MRSLAVSLLALGAIWAMNHDGSTDESCDHMVTIDSGHVRAWQPGDAYESVICGDRS